MPLANGVFDGIPLGTGPSLHKAGPMLHLQRNLQRIFLSLQQKTAARRWFLLALVLGGLFVVFTIMYTIGLFDQLALFSARLLLTRPIGRLDCIFSEWRQIGEVPVMAILLLILGIICWRLGYHWKIIPILLLLLVFFEGIETIGKATLPLAVPSELHSGMGALDCPQMWGKPISVRLETMAGLWWKIPPPSEGEISWAQYVVKQPISSGPSIAVSEIYAYPGGHAMRWSFLGLVISWLCWQHIRQLAWRTILTILCFLASFLGGLMQFSLGVHFLPDTIAGYILGATMACLAISFLIILNTHSQRKAMQSLALTIPEKGC